MRVVLDSNILVRAFMRKAGPANQALIATLSETLILSNEILHEVTRVLRYPRMLQIHEQSEEEVYGFVESLRGAAIVIPLDVAGLSPIRDSNDVFVVQTATRGDADVLCTRDRDFFSPPASTFLANCGIAVMTDIQLIQRLRE
ncbi:MAG: putative toxin-antitoxin system toxin component, PIN family [Terracidiphilus sp.]